MRKQLNQVIKAMLVLALAPAGLAAQEPGALDPNQLPAEAQELLVQMQQVQSQIEPIRQQALADPELQAEQAALGQQIQVAMAESDPAVPQQMERLQALMTEAQAAQAAQDQAKMGEIVTEARGIEQQLQAAQMQAIQRPEIAPQVQGFQAKLQAKMTELNPETTQLLQRLEELDRQLGALIAPTQ